MKKVYYLTEYREIGCVNNLNRISVLVNDYVNQYMFRVEFIDIVFISEFEIEYIIFDLDLKENISYTMNYSTLKVV